MAFNMSVLKEMSSHFTFFFSLHILESKNRIIYIKKIP